VQGKLERLGFSRYLFIYVVRQPLVDDVTYATVLAYGRTAAEAEQVAINRVHQEGLHIVRTDTATPAPWLDPGRDGAYLEELERCGSALHVDVHSQPAALVA
jgi:hypothetical protein